ncbi:hypothetical protein [Chromobacterium phragmitis]|uniref:Transcriptional regulator n=1 Tax=Chromobacterium phragmitis TaxID=2202141 RepID=A0ABV0ITI7_9NEIS
MEKASIQELRHGPKPYSAIAQLRLRSHLPGRARLAASGIVSHRHKEGYRLCAATLSLLLDMARIDVGVIDDAADLFCELKPRS